jgi:endonuclease III
MRDQRIIVVHERLKEAIRDTRPLIVYDGPFQLLIAVILSAQTTDEQVNRVTPTLFARYPDAASLARASIDELEAIVHATGFYRTKAKHIRLAAAALVERFGGAVPQTVDELVTLPGVGRKSANVVVGACFGKPAVIVDTHFKRVTKRLGFTASDDPARVERDLVAITPDAIRYSFSMLVNRHGRTVCTARNPQCVGCVLADLCPSAVRG